MQRCSFSAHPHVHAHSTKLSDETRSSNTKHFRKALQGTHERQAPVHAAPCLDSKPEVCLLRCGNGALWTPDRWGILSSLCRMSKANFSSMIWKCQSRCEYRITDASAAEQRKRRSRLLWHSVIFILDAPALVFLCTPCTYFGSRPLCVYLHLLSKVQERAKTVFFTKNSPAETYWALQFISTDEFFGAASLSSLLKWDGESVYRLQPVLNIWAEIPRFQIFLNILLWKLFGVINPEWLITECRLNWTHFLNCLSALAKAPAWGGLRLRRAPPLL